MRRHTKETVFRHGFVCYAQVQQDGGISLIQRFFGCATLVRFSIKIPIFGFNLTFAKSRSVKLVRPTETSLTLWFNIRKCLY